MNTPKNNADIFRPANNVFVAFLFVAMAVLCGCNNEVVKKDVNSDPDIPSTQSQTELSNLERLVSSEEIILALGEKLATLNAAAHNLAIPFGTSKSTFTEEVIVQDISVVQTRQSLNGYVELEEWDKGSKELTKNIDLWRPFLEKVAWFESAKFYMVSATLDQNGKQLHSQIGFASRLRLANGKLASASAKIEATWEVNQSNYLDSKISAWYTKKFNCLNSENSLFEEVTSHTIEDSTLAESLAESKQEELTRRLILGERVEAPKDDKYQAMFFEVTLEHPAVSIVDFDGDGLDDFFLARRYLPSLMFRNQGDGSFVEVGEKVGLNIEKDCVCSLFNDFDNDGDQDAFIGRSRHRALYMRNEDGKYVDRSDSIKGVELPYMVSSMCAADYNNDGLADIYFSTYSPIEGSHMQMLTKGLRWPSHFLNVIDRVELEERQKNETAYVDVVGPPNLLLKNHGDHFAIADVYSSVESWRKSFQSSWCDFDQDGDQDLYVCNDFAPDDLYRNDMNDGFVRISDDVGLNTLGFGMGVSWQDHNNDGKFDLYVSNMYSKAGTRITRQIEGLDPRLEQMAKGNYLYEFDGERFNLVSLEGPNQAVSKTGWSWGGQMVDLDNDGFHDIAVPNGYYSAPKEVEIKVDL